MPIYDVRVKHNETHETESLKISGETREDVIEKANEMYADGWAVDSIDGADDQTPFEESNPYQQVDGSKMETTASESDEDVGIYRVTMVHPAEDAPRSLHVEATDEDDATYIATSTLPSDGWEATDIESVEYEEMKETDTVREDITETPPENTGVAKDLDGGESSREIEPDELLEECASMYRAKEGDYGEAWRVAGETLAMWSEQLDISFDPTDPAQAVLWNLYMQRLHKLLRGFNLEFSDSDPANEAPAESHADESTYAAIHASYVNEQTDE